MEARTGWFVAAVMVLLAGQLSACDLLSADCACDVDEETSGADTPSLGGGNPFTQAKTCEGHGDCEKGDVCLRPDGKCDAEVGACVDPNDESLGDPGEVCGAAHRRSARPFHV